jgi:hypothetical protein
MLQHVSLEVPPDRIEPGVRFWELLGFTRVEAPEPIAGFVTWLDRDGTHIHLIHTPEPAVPRLGHVGVVVDDFAAAVSSLRDAGFDVDPIVSGLAPSFGIAERRRHSHSERGRAPGDQVGIGAPNISPRRAATSKSPSISSSPFISSRGG